MPAEDLQATERGVFTKDGRFFVIGVRPEGRRDAGAWVTEVTRQGQGKYVATNYVAGALEGTVNGAVGAAPAGDACIFTGMAGGLYVLPSSAVFR